MAPLGVVIGTGPSLADVADTLRELKGRVMLFGINNTFQDFDLDCWIACDPKWHEYYGRVEGNFDKWHWDKAICEQHGYNYIEGVWMDGLSTDLNKLSLGHASGWQALNLALHYHNRGLIDGPILLVGHDMCYRKDEPRHYFNLSETAGEYPSELRKYSLFLKPDGSGLLTNYKHIADQCSRREIPPIINCTPRSVMTWFPIRPIWDFV